MPHYPALDGLRGLAVLMVVAYHFHWIPGGGHGVTVFFVLSGFLITRIILTKVDAGTWSWRRFYIRRARRLLPALFAFTAVTLAVVWEPWNAWPALTYIANYVTIERGTLGS